MRCITDDNPQLLSISFITCESAISPLVMAPLCESLARIKFLPFDPCFKVKWSHHSKKLFYLLIFDSRASKCENALQEIMACNFFASAKFDL